MLKNCYNCDAPNGEKLQCGDYICPKCLQNKLKERGNGEINRSHLDKMNCQCGQHIYQGLVLKIIKIKTGRSLRNCQSTSSSMNHSKSSVKEVKISCPICYLDYQVKDIVTLNCDHRFCRHCVHNDIMMKIQQGKVDDQDFPCPTGICEENIPFYVRDSLLSLQQREKQDYFMLKKMSEQTQDQNQDQVFRKCPLCDMFVCIPKGLNQIYCSRQGCMYKFCPKCFETEHKTLSCIEYNLRQKGLKNLDNKTLKLIAGNDNFKFCPKCHTLIQKNRGCKYMNCKSPQCKGKTNFCFSCLKVLSSKHEKHDCPDKSEPITNRCLIF